jgi:hypothetical protein
MIIKGKQFGRISTAGNSFFDKDYGISSDRSGNPGKDTPFHFTFHNVGKSTLARCEDVSTFVPSERNSPALRMAIQELEDSAIMGELAKDLRIRSSERKWHRYEEKPNSIRDFAEIPGFVSATQGDNPYGKNGMKERLK